MRWLAWAVGFSIACVDDAAPGFDASVDAHVSMSDTGLGDAGLDAGAPLPDAGPGSAEDTVREMYARYVEAGWIDSVSIALVEPEGETFIGLGRLSATDDRAPDADALYEIASISKVFTGLLLAQMVEAGEITVEDSIDSLLPETVMVPSRSGLEITLAHLTTHHSGLPRLANNMPNGDPADPYSDYTTELLYAFLNEYELPRDPGAAFEYSNVAVGLLGHGLGRRAGSDWWTALDTRVVAPLALADTTPEPSDDQLARFAQPHDGDRREVDDWSYLDSSAGACALRSTARDLARFARAQFDPSSAGELSPAIERSHTMLAAENDRIGIAYGWFLLADGDILFHNGRTAGTVSTFLIDLDDDRAVVALINTDVVSISDSLAAAAFNVWRGFSPEIPTPPVDAVLPSETLDAYVGRYAAIGATIEISREGDRLFLRLNDGPRRGLYASSETEFYLRAIEGSVTFRREGTAPAHQLVFHQSRDYLFRRE
jgi:D-alanyl-D-alanine-carboxypeptidase/D-alanyl-D-alanine-endopeptidase